MAKRSDAWTKEHDAYLVGVVLEYIATGRTQLAAFELVGEKLNRTSEACGFRWNSDLRHRYPKLIEEAKRQRLALKKGQSKSKDKNDRVTPVQQVVEYHIKMTSEEVEALARMFNRNKVPVELMQLRKDINKLVG